ncbi:unnamed protein product [Caenorhabditis brenneri]
MPPSTSTSTYYAYGIVIICTLFLASVFLVSSPHSTAGNLGVHNAEAAAPVFAVKTTVANSSLIAGNETVANGTAVHETTKTLIQDVTADLTAATPTTSHHSEMSLVIAVIIMVIVLLVALVVSEYLADRRTHEIVERIRMVVIVPFPRSPDNTKHILTTLLICTIVVGVVLVVGIATLPLTAATMAKSPAKTPAVDATTTTEAMVASTLFAECPDPTFLAVAAFLFMIFLIVLFYFVFVPLLLRYVDHDGYAAIGKKTEKAPLEKVAVKF